MSIWFRNLLLVLTIGGGFGGVMVSVARLGTSNQPISFYLVGVLFLLLYAYGIFAGLRLAGPTVPYGHLYAYYALQVPLILSPVISYRFTSGFDVMLEIIGSRIGCVFNLGSDSRLTFFASSEWGAGINMLALVVIFSLYVHRFYEREGSSSVQPEKKKEPQPYDYLLPSSPRPNQAMQRNRGLSLCLATLLCERHF